MSTIYIIGNSFIGALLKAFKADPGLAQGHELKFFGAGGDNFKNVEFVDGKICNVPFMSDPLCNDIKLADCIVIYADLPNPSYLGLMANSLRNQKYSEQVIQYTLADRIRRSPSYRAFKLIGKLSDARLFVLSGNVPTDVRPIDAATYDAGLDATINLLGNAYIPLPRSIFDSAYVPLLEFYKNSIRVDGSENPEKGTPGDDHDRRHMNEHGGRLILQSVIERINSDSLIGNDLPAPVPFAT